MWGLRIRLHWCVWGRGWCGVAAACLADPGWGGKGKVGLGEASLGLLWVLGSC